MCGGISCFSKLPDRAKERRRKKQNLRKRASLFSIQSYLSFLFNFYSEISLNFRLEDNGWVYETFGISKRFPINPLQCSLNVLPLKSALSAKCFIYRVTNWPLFIFNQLAINFAVSRAFGQTHSLTSFGRAVGFLSDLAMCVAVKRGLYDSLFQPLCNFLFVKMFLKFYEKSAYVGHISQNFFGIFQ